jgi:hypothetical protein
VLGLRRGEANYFGAAYVASRAGVAWFGQAASVGKPEPGAPSAAALRYYSSRLIEELGELDRLRAAWA